MSAPLFSQLSVNVHASSENRRRLDAAGTICVNLLGSVGSGKTTLLAAILPRLRAKIRVGIIAAGDLRPGTSPFEALDVPLVTADLTAGTRLTPADVHAALSEFDLSELDLILIENAGSLAQQTAEDLGEHVRIAALSVSSGQTVLERHPALLRGVAVVVLTKYDLVPRTHVDLDGLVHQLRRTNPRAEVLCTDTRGRVGTDRLAGWLLGYVRAQRIRPTQPTRGLEPVGLPT
jgi:hydrogenase nickel incorporation protein HypB